MTSQSWHGKSKMDKQRTGGMVGGRGGEGWGAGGGGGADSVGAYLSLNNLFCT